MHDAIVKRAGRRPGAGTGQRFRTAPCTPLWLYRNGAVRRLDSMKEQPRSMTESTVVFTRKRTCRARRGSRARLRKELADHEPNPSHPVFFVPARTPFRCCRRSRELPARRPGRLFLCRELVSGDRVEGYFLRRGHPVERRSRGSAVICAPIDPPRAIQINPVQG